MPSLSNRDSFEEFVITHQSSVESGGNWFPANHAYSKRFRVRRAARIPWLNSRWAKGAKDLVRVSVEFPNRLLAEVSQQRIPIRVLHYSNALIRTAVWSPKSNSETNIAENGLSSFQDDSVGLNLDIEAIGSVWLWSGRCAGCGNHRWTVEIGDRQGRVCLSITIGAESLEDDWRRLIVACLS